MAQKAVVLVSGGLDSATVLAMAESAGFDCYPLCFSYGQRHLAELDAARTVCLARTGREPRVITVDLSAFGGSALTDAGIAVPESPTRGIPVTYVPARNTVFLSLALAYAEVLESRDIFIGVNAVDYSGYPDCRPEFISAFQLLANIATRAGVEGRSMTIHAPLLEWSKGRIIEQGIALGVNYAQTVSCYQATDAGLACGRCDSCRLRAQGFRDAGVSDPTRYVSGSG
jgi:7-cyano-7-deazaguanine synthase